MRKTIHSSAVIGVILLGLLAVGGCAVGKTYLLDLHYSSPISPFLPEEAKPATVALYNFKDVRPDTLYIGQRVYHDGRVDFFKVDAASVSQALNKSVNHLLTNAGFRVVAVNRYLEPDKVDFKDIPAPLGLGGEIESLWVESKSGIATTQTVAKLRLRIHWVLTKDKTWLNKTIEGSAQESDRPLFRPQNAEAKLNEVFQESLDKLLKDEPKLKSYLLANP